MPELFPKNADAPNFSLLNSHAKITSLSDFEGSWLLLYFYPKDNTPGCTVEAKDFSFYVEDFNKLNIQVVGVSKDSIKSHCNFIANHELRIELLSDPEAEVIKAYKAWGVKKNYGKEYQGLIRSTFLINPQGQIAKYWSNVRAKGHAERVLKEAKELLQIK